MSAETRARRLAAFKRVAELRKTLGAFDVALVHLQREHARVYDAIDVIRRMTDEQKATLGRAVDALETLPL